MGGTTSTGLPYPDGSDMARDGDNAIKALAQALDALCADTGWIPLPPLQGGWTQYPSWEPHGYRKKNGLVFLRGMLQGSGTSGLLVTMPEGFRNGSNPGAHTQVASGSATGGIVNIWADGRILLNSHIGGGWVSLNGICYVAEN